MIQIVQQIQKAFKIHIKKRRETCLSQTLNTPV